MIENGGSSTSRGTEEDSDDGDMSGVDVPEKTEHENEGTRLEVEGAENKVTRKRTASCFSKRENEAVKKPRHVN